MKDYMCTVILFTMFLLPSPMFAQQGTSDDLRTEIKQNHNRNALVVTPNGPRDGGDFGPFTVGTKTSGLQEAFNAAKEQSKSLYIAGGNWTIDKKESGVIYRLQETLHVPWFQNFGLYGGEYVIVHEKDDGPAITIDSQMNCHFDWGLIVGGRSADQPVVEIKPSNPGPDRLICFVACTLEFNGIVGTGGKWHFDENHTGIGLVLDGTAGAITNNRFSFGEFNWCKTGLYLKNKVNGNIFQSPWYHHCNTGIKIGSAEHPDNNRNMIEGILVLDGIGLDIWGSQNIVRVQIQGSHPQQSVIFRKSAQRNLVVTPSLEQGITNSASVPTNRVITTLPAGFSVKTPPVPKSGQAVVNANPFGVEVRITDPGEVVRWQERDAKGVVRDFIGGWTKNTTFLLNPGEKLLI